jgi:ATP-binding cassette, subfamily G (WHITE), member 2, SNQ2
MAAKPACLPLHVGLVDSLVLVFCDEPTSGLDSQAAWGVVQFLRKLADAGQSILCTIHQPSAVLFEQFDRLLLLQKGGKTVYFGDTGVGSKTLINYFEKNRGSSCSPEANPAEYILEQIGAGATSSAAHDWHDVEPDISISDSRSGSTAKNADKPCRTSRRFTRD